MSTIIIGAGPAGLFMADRLADAGEKEVTILDAGKPMEDRWCPETRACACRSCFVLEGMGGAGGFSDGKLPFALDRGTQLEQIFQSQDEAKLWEIDEVVRELAGDGVWYAPDGAESGWDFGPYARFGTYPLRHVGSDGVRRWSTGMSKRVAAKGVNIQYGHTVKRVYEYDRGWEVMGFGPSHWEADRVVIATGIQGIPWSEGLFQGLHVPLRHGPAGIGLRVETPAEDMQPLFDRFYDWKIVYERPDTPIVLRSFCCNSHGEIVNQYHRTMGIRGVNGHAPIDDAQKTQSSNFAVVAKIPTDYVADPQAYVRSIAQTVNALTEGHTGVESLHNFLMGSSLDETSLIAPDWRTNKVMARYAPVHRGFPMELLELYREFIWRIFKAVPSLNASNALVYAPELKYPALRVPVDFRTWEVKGKPGLYCVGDATGYLDSFVAAAVSGLIAAEHIAGGVPAVAN
jgi:uncharacterized FAD-dependent dehydrogenase